MNRVFRGFGERIEVKAPTGDLLGALQANRNGLDEMRALCKGALVSPTLADLEKKSPACARPLARMIAGLYGLSDPSEVLELEENDIDPALAAVMVEREAAGFSGLYAMRFVPDPALKEEPLTLLLRAAKSARDLDEVNRNPHSHAAAVAVTKRLCVHGPIEELEKRFPGAFGPIALMILSKAGLVEELTVGEA